MHRSKTPPTSKACCPCLSILGMKTRPLVLTRNDQSQKNSSRPESASKNQERAEAYGLKGRNLCTQQIVHIFGVGLALACLHHLTDQCIKGLVFAGFDLFHLIGIAG